MVIGTGKVPDCFPGESRDQRSGTFLFGAGREHEDRDVLVLLDQLDDLLGPAAFANDQLRLD